MDLGLDGRRFLVTGGTRGIGRAIAEGLLAEGAAVAVCARTAAEVPGALVRTVDVTDGPALARVVAEVAGELGGLDGVVANAGGAQGGGLLDSSDEDWQATYALNAGHFVALVRAAHPWLAASEAGCALVVSSISGSKPAPRAQYGAAKAAASNAAASLARELAPDRIRVNAVSPGSVLFDGGGWDRMRAEQPERFAAFVERDLPWERLGTPAEVAALACFVLSPRASWVNGTDVAVDGAQGRPSAGGW